MVAVAKVCNVELRIAGGDERQRQWELDATQDLRTGHPEATGRFHGVLVYARHSCPAVGQDRRDGESGERDDGRLGRDAERRQAREQDQDRERRHRTRDVCQQCDEGAAAAEVSERDPDAQTDDGPDNDGFGGDLDVQPRQMKDPVARVVVHPVAPTW